MLGMRTRLSFTAKNGLIRQDDDAELHNGMSWSADGQSVFLADSNAGAIHVWLRSGIGVAWRRGAIRTHTEGLGLPGGAAIDAQGYYWCAVHGGARLRRYGPDGQLDRELPLPISKPTMCAFAGDDLDSLYVTSASDGMNSDQLRAEPHTGALFRLSVGVRGIARPHTAR